MLTQLMSRSISRWLAAPLALLAVIAFRAPSGPSASELIAASLGRMDVSGTPAALPAALAPLVTGQAADPRAVNAAASQSALSGSEGATGRVIVPVGDANGDNTPDLLDFRATGGTLTYRLMSGTNGATIWQAPAITRPADVHASIYAARINAGALDAYLLDQYEADDELIWTLRAIDGATGSTIWSATGTLPTGVKDPTANPPSIPPSVPPVSVPPSGLPTTLPSDLPTTPPSEVPSDLPLPSDLPTTLPSDVPSDVPSDLPTTIPSDLPVPSDLPTTLPSDVPSDIPSDIPSDVPSDIPSDVPSDLPVPTPTISPPAGAPQSAQNRSSAAADSPVPFAAYATGVATDDLDGDGFDDFAVTQTLALTLPDSSVAILSQLSTVASATGRSIGTVLATGRNAVPSVGVAGDFLGTGSSGLYAIDEIATGSGSIVTYRAHTAQGAPVFAAADSASSGYIGVYDAMHDLTGDGLADIMVNRYPIQTGSGPSLVAVRSAPLGQSAWARTLDESAIAFVAGPLDGGAGDDIVTQGPLVTAPGKIPSHVVYRSLGGGGADLYVSKVTVANGGGVGDWAATFSHDAGMIDGDAFNDLFHAVNAIPSDGQATQWSQAAVSTKTGATLWNRTATLNPGAPIGGNIVADAAADIVDVQESTTKTSDSLVIKAASGADGSPVWTARVLVGGGTERVRGLHVQSMNPSGTGDMVITVIQRSGTRARTLVVAVRGTTGQVMWIRTT